MPTEKLNLTAFTEIIARFCLANVVKIVQKLFSKTDSPLLEQFNWITFYGLAELLRGLSPNLELLKPQKDKKNVSAQIPADA